jgi:hypothetical protein
MHTFVRYNKTNQIRKVIPKNSTKRLCITGIFALYIPCKANAINLRNFTYGILYIIYLTKIIQNVYGVFG